HFTFGYVQDDEICVCLAGFGHLKAIPRAAHCFEIARVFRVTLNLFADATYVHIDRTRCDEAGIAPDGIEQMIAAEDTSGVPGEIVQQAELGRSSGGEFAAHFELHRAGIDVDLFEADDRRRGGTLEAAQHGLDPSDQLTHCEGLGDVVVRAKLEAEDTIIFTSARGDKDDGHAAEPGMRAKSAADLEAVATGNHDVEEEERGGLAFGVGNEIGGSGEAANRKACGFQLVLDQPRDVWIVFENEYGLAQEPSLL